MKIEVETEVAAPPDVVYATVTDVVRWPDLMRGVERVEILTPDALATGTMFRETRTIFGRSATEEMTVAAYDPPADSISSPRTMAPVTLSSTTLRPRAAAIDFRRHAGDAGGEGRLGRCSPVQGCRYEAIAVRPCGREGGS